MNGTSFPADVSLLGFQTAPFKIGVQKEGYLSDVSRKVLGKIYNSSIPPYNSNERRLEKLEEIKVLATPFPKTVMSILKKKV